jgi:hypothetical protein
LDKLVSLGEAELATEKARNFRLPNNQGTTSADKDFSSASAGADNADSVGEELVAGAA